MLQDPIIIITITCAVALKVLMFILVFLQSTSKAAT